MPPPSRSRLGRARRACAAVALLAALPSCAATTRRFPLAPPMARDGDLSSVSLPCFADPTKKDPNHVACSPETYVSPLIWDGVDNMIFRPLSGLFAVNPPGAAINVNSLDEVPDSAWFTNRVGVHPMSVEELSLGACDKKLMLDGEGAEAGSWVIDKGKSNGSSPGFRVKIPGKGLYLFKADDKAFPERPSAGSVVGAAAYNAVGFNTSCEQIVYFKRSALKLTPGLRFEDNSGLEKDFDQQALDKILEGAPTRGELVRMQASAWIPGRLIGPFRYEGTRHDDPNDVVPHEERRELRGGRLLAAWLDHFDAREQNSMDVWVADKKPGEGAEAAAGKGEGKEDKKGGGKDEKEDKKGNPDASPGFVRHYYLDMSDCLGSEWEWDGISRRLGYSYILDYGDIALDFITFGAILRPWDTIQRTPGREKFGYFNVKDFVPENWKNEYPNAAFSRMTERDGAWMARILAHFTPQMVAALARMGDFTDKGDTVFVAATLEGRLERILDRYLTRLSPMSEVRIENRTQLCAVDLAEMRGVRPAASFTFAARSSQGISLAVTRREGAGVCVALPQAAPDGVRADDDPSRYLRVALEDGVARGPLVAHLYDLGPARGFALAGLERPER